jgi:hypothetical protein
MPEIELDLNGNARFICYASVTVLDSDVESGSEKNENCDHRIRAGTHIVAMKPIRLSGGGGRFKHTTAPLDQMAPGFRSCLSRPPPPKFLPLWFHRVILSLRCGEQRAVGNLADNLLDLHVI